MAEEKSKAVCFAAVAVERTAFHFDQPFDYAVAPLMQGKIEAGARVKVPFGTGKAHRLGVVLELHNRPPEAARVRPIAQLLDEEALLPPDLTALIPWLKEQCFCTLYEAYCAVMPVGLRHNMQVLYSALPPDEAPSEALLEPAAQQLLTTLRKARSPFTKREDLLRRCKLPADSPLPERLAQQGFLLRHTDALQNAGERVQRVYRLTEEGAALTLAPRQAEVAAFLRQNGAASLRELCGYVGVSPAVVQALEKKGAVVSVEPEPPAEPSDPPPPIRLTPAQQTAFDHLCAPKKPTALLFGVTGSGKTSVYLRLIDEVLAKGRSAMVLVPEIALTPQMLSIFVGRYGENVALFHSERSVGERSAAWRRVRSGQVRIVLGTRSAVFAPLQNIGLIVLDEEHEHSYKSEQSPRFHAREVAKYRAAQHGAQLLLSSATPSVESYAAALKGRYQLETLPGRYGTAKLPQVRTVDLLSQEFLLSMELLAALKEQLADGRQAILLMNRRGYHTYLACTSCKEVVQCPQCSISMAYHLANDRVICHYCGHSAKAPAHCPACGKLTIRFGGAGTQKLEDELRRLLPEVRVARMDADSTAQKHAREEILTRFAAHEYDVLVGTQMVAKGLDFENVTLVGVVNIDQQLYFDDYRALERSFSLLTQVAGRAGRGQYPGLALVQTINPFNEVIRQAAAQDYPAFFAGEIRVRKLMTYPPFCDICMLALVGENEQMVKTAAKYLLEQLRQQSRGEYAGEKLIVLGPGPARVSRVNRKFRWRLLIKCKNSPRFRALIAQLLREFGKDPRFQEVTAFADMNPEAIL